jgi:hypothetical protein
MSETALYIYCLVERARPPATAKAPRGLAGATAPALLEITPSLWAVVAEVPLSEYGSAHLETRLKDIAWVADVAVAHESIVEHFAAGAGATVVPMKLFTMFSSRERAIADLKTRRREVRRVLDRIRGCQEWGVRVTAEPLPSRSTRRPAQRAASGTAFLAAKKQARDDARQHARESLKAAESAYVALAGLSKAARRREAPEASTRPPLVDAAFLVAADDRARFRAAATRQARRCRASGAAMVLTGPWPAYNFVTLDGDRA